MSLMSRTWPGIVAMTLMVGVSGRTDAGPIVTFYDDEAKFHAAIASPTSIDFEGIVADNAVKDFGAAFRVGDVTFTSPNVPFSDDVLVVGKSSQTLGAPFDSALLIPIGEPSTLEATFNPTGPRFSAVGGTFLGLFGDAQSLGSLTLTGTSGVLDNRTVLLGIATAGKPKTFFGYTVFGDDVVSIRLSISTNAPAIENFVSGIAVPEPSSLALCGIAGVAGLAYAGYGRRRTATA